MVQLNLLPDIKLQYIKTKRTKRMVIGISLVVIVASIALFLLMFSFVNIAQKGHISRLDKETSASISKIQNTPGINEILTIQNQLSVVNPAHEAKPATERVLPFINQFIPPGSKITNIQIDFTANTLSVSGTSPDIQTVNKIIDSFKFATFVTKSSPDDKSRHPFTDVVSSGLSVSNAAESPFSINMTFDKSIFVNTDEATIHIPGICSTRSCTEKPESLFAQPVTQSSGSTSDSGAQNGGSNGN